MSRKHVNYEEDKNKVPMNKPYNIQNTNICNGIFHISFFKALLINEGETTRYHMKKYLVCQTIDYMQMSYDYEYKELSIPF